jgi:hypothetical protein
MIVEIEWPLFVHVVEQRLPGKLKPAPFAVLLGTGCRHLIYSIPKVLVRTSHKKNAKKSSDLRDSRFPER